VSTKKILTKKGVTNQAVVPGNKKLKVKKKDGEKKQVQPVAVVASDSDTDVEDEDDVMTQVQVDDEITLNISEHSLKQMARGGLLKVTQKDATAAPPAGKIGLLKVTQKDATAAPPAGKIVTKPVSKGSKVEKAKKKVLGVRKGRSGANTRSVNVKL
jgi:hypothetical protein